MQSVTSGPLTRMIQSGIACRSAPDAAVRGGRCGSLLRLILHLLHLLFPTLYGCPCPCRSFVPISPLLSWPSSPSPPKLSRSLTVILFALDDPVRVVSPLMIFHSFGSCSCFRGFLLLLVQPGTFQSGAAHSIPGCSNTGLRSAAPRMFGSGGPCCLPSWSSPDAPVRGRGACVLGSWAPRMFQPCFLVDSSWPAPDVPVPGTGPTPPDDLVWGCASLRPGCSSLGRHIVGLCRLWTAVAVGVLLFSSRALRCSSFPCFLVLCVLSFSSLPSLLVLSFSSNPQFPLSSSCRCVPCSLWPLPSLPSTRVPSLRGAFVGGRTQAPSLYARTLLCFGAGAQAQARSPVFSFLRFGSLFFTACSHAHLSLPPSHALCGVLGRALKHLFSTHALCHHFASPRSLPASSSLSVWLLSS